MPVFKNIAFIGGIHGVGKSTICKHICENLNINYLSASQIIKWAEFNDDAKNKKVTDIPLTQNRLIDELHQIIEKDKYYLLDGHYCLLNKESVITKIPFKTFEMINPNSLHLIINEISEIKSRIEERDKRSYDFNLLEEMQNTEINYAKELSVKLGVQLSIGKECDYSQISSLLNNVINT
jgi:adenylate kinase